MGGTSLNLELASPATGALTRVWYSQNGEILSVATPSGRVFETSDFEHWRLGTSVAPSVGAIPGLIGQGSARLVSAGLKLYAAGEDNVYTSDDSGKTWVNLTGFNHRSVIGSGFSGIAISPRDPREIAVVNASGAWRSLDGGLSWSGLNTDLPNLPARRFDDSRTSLVLQNGRIAELISGRWTLTAGQPRRSIDPHIWQDPENPGVTLKATGAKLSRTINGGLFWDDITGDTSPGDINSIAADRTAGVVYLATSRGLLSAEISLNSAAPTTTRWTAVGRDLPAAAALDVRLNPDHTLDVLLEGYGVYSAPAPHRPAGIRLLNAADLTDRPAAPGSLISVVGAGIRDARGAGAVYPVIASAETATQLQVPFEVSPGSVLLALEGPTGNWTAPISIKGASPAIFVDSEGAPLLLDSESGLVLDTTTPVHAGSLIALLATGLGRVTPDWPSGSPAPADAPPRVRAAVNAFLDGAPLEVTRATLAPGYVGYYVIELRVPALVNRGLAELRVVVDDTESNRVRVFIESTPPRQ